MVNMIDEEMNSSDATENGVKSPPPSPKPTTDEQIITDTNVNDCGIEEIDDLAKVLKLLINFTYEECVNRFVHKNGSFMETFFWILKGCCCDDILVSNEVTRPYKNKLFCVFLIRLFSLYLKTNDIRYLVQIREKLFEQRHPNRILSLAMANGFKFACLKKMACLVETALIGDVRVEFEEFILKQDLIGEICLYSCYTNEEMFNDLCLILKSTTGDGTILSKLAKNIEFEVNGAERTDIVQGFVEYLEYRNTANGDIDNLNSYKSPVKAASNDNSGVPVAQQPRVIGEGNLEAPLTQQVQAAQNGLQPVSDSSHVVQEVPDNSEKQATQQESQNDAVSASDEATSKAKAAVDQSNARQVKQESLTPKANNVKPTTDLVDRVPLPALVNDETNAEPLTQRRTSRLASAKQPEQAQEPQGSQRESVAERVEQESQGSQVTRQGNVIEEQAILEAEMNQDMNMELDLPLNEDSHELMNMSGAKNASVNNDENSKQGSDVNCSFKSAVSDPKLTIMHPIIVIEKVTIDQSPVKQKPTSGKSNDHVIDQPLSDTESDVVRPPVKKSKNRLSNRIPKIKMNDVDDSSDSDLSFQLAPAGCGKQEKLKRVLLKTDKTVDKTPVKANVQATSNVVSLDSEDDTTIGVSNVQPTTTRAIQNSQSASTGSQSKLKKFATTPISNDDPFSLEDALNDISCTSFKIKSFKRTSNSAHSQIPGCTTSDEDSDVDLKSEFSKSARKRRVWTTTECVFLIHGVETYGRGNWAKILMTYRSKFPDRKSTDLKDKLRNLEKHPDELKRLRSKCKMLKERLQSMAEVVESDEDGSLVIGTPSKKIKSPNGL